MALDYGAAASTKKGFETISSYPTPAIASSALPLFSTSVRPSPSHKSVPSSRLPRLGGFQEKEELARFLGGRTGSINRESDGDCEKYRFASAFAGSLSLLGNEGSSDSG
jgi:hypothetical protein